MSPRRPAAVGSRVSIAVLALTLAAGATAEASAQVAAVTELKDNVAAVEVRNPSVQVQSVEIALHHGEVVDGKLVLGQAVDAIVGPRAFRLAPGAGQTVRVLVREDVESGTVLRLVTTLTPIPPPAERGRTTSQIILATQLITKLVVN